MKLIAVREAHRFDEDALFGFLSGDLDGFSGDATVQQFAGGQSNPTFLVTTGENRRFVLRKKPPGRLLPSAHAVEREFAVIRALADTDVPVPTAHLLCEDTTVIGTPFYVMDFIDGRVFGDPTLPGVSADERTAMYDSMNDVLARIHSVDWRAVGLESFGKPERYVERQIKRWSAQYEASKTETIASMDSLIAWLPEHVPTKDETTIVHGDFRPGNLLFHPTEPRVVGVLDWELSTLGHPLGDLAYNCMAYRLPPSDAELSGLMGVDVGALGIPTEAEFIAAYAARVGRASVEDWSFFLAFSLFRIAAICQGVYKRSLDGNASDAKAGMFGFVAKLMADLAWSTASS